MRIEIMIDKEQKISQATLLSLIHIWIIFIYG